MIIDNLASLPSTITTGDELPVERGTTTYKIDYNALAAAILARLGAGSDNIVDVPNGGTGAATAEAARTNLGITPANIGAAPANYLYSGNADDLRSIGVYYLAGATGTGVGPNNLWGMLVVAGNNDGTRAVQLYIDIWSDSAMFRRYSGSWSAWKAFTLTT